MDEAAQYYAARNQQRQFTNTGPMAGYETSGLVGTGRQLRRTTGGSYLHQSDYSGPNRTDVAGLPDPLVMRSTTRATRYNGSGRRYATPALQRFKQGDLKPTFAGLGRLLGRVTGVAGEAAGNILRDTLNYQQDQQNQPPPTLPPPQAPIPPPPPPGGPNWPAPTTAAPAPNWNPPTPGWNPPAQGNPSGWNAPSVSNVVGMSGRTARVASAAGAAGAGAAGAGTAGAGTARAIANAGRLLARAPKVIPL